MSKNPSTIAARILSINKPEELTTELWDDIITMATALKPQASPLENLDLNDMQIWTFKEDELKQTSPGLKEIWDKLKNILKSA